MPGGGAQAAELLGTGGALRLHCLVLVTTADVADGVAAGFRAPGTTWVQGYLSIQTKGFM